MATPQRIILGYNNVYTLGARDEMVLIDTGPDFKGSRELIRAALRTPPALVIATHGHLDHAGLGNHWQQNGVPVAMGVEDCHLATAPQLAQPAEFDNLCGFVRCSGAPPEVQLEVIAGLEQRRRWAQAAAKGPAYAAVGRDARWPSGLRYESFLPERLLFEGTLPGSQLGVVLCPGHTPGNLVVIDESEGWLFSGDQLLPEMAPTPAIQSNPGSATGANWRFRSLPAFAASLRRLAGLRFTRCFPGHGEPFGEVGDVIAANVAQIEQRTERAAEAMADLGAASLYGLCQQLYPRALRRRFWQILATVQGHLDILEEEGRVRFVDGRYEPRG